MNLGNSQYAELNNTLLHNQRVKDIKIEIRKYFEINRNEDRSYQNLGGPIKAMQRGNI